MAKKLLNVKDRSYKTLSDTDKEKYKSVSSVIVNDPKVQEYVSERSANNYPYCDDFLQQAEYFDDYLKTDETLKHYVDQLASHHYSGMYKSTLTINRLAFPPIFGITSEDVINASKNMSFSPVSGRFGTSFSDEYNKWFNKYVDDNVSNTYIAEMIKQAYSSHIFSFYSSYKWNEEILFEIVLINEFLNHQDPNKDITLLEFRKKNYQKLLSLYYSHDYSSSEHTKTLHKKSMSKSYLSSHIFLASTYSKKIDKDAIRNLTQKDALKVLYSLDDLQTESNISAHNVIKVVLSDDNETTTPAVTSEEYQNLLMKITVSALQNNDNSLYILETLCSNFVKSLNDISFDELKVGNNLVWASRIYDIITKVVNHEKYAQWKTHEKIGFIQSLNGYSKKFSVEKATFDAYITFLESLVDKEETFTKLNDIACLLGDVFFSRVQAPTLQEWKNISDNYDESGQNIDVVHFTVTNLYQNKDSAITMSNHNSITTMMSKSFIKMLK